MSLPETWQKWEARGSLKNALLVGTEDDLILQVQKSWAGYRVGDFAIGRQYADGTFVVEMPMSQDMIREQRAQGSLITTLLTVIDVPAEYVRVVLHPKELVV